MAFRTLSFANFKVFLGDGGSPENFIAQAAFRDKSMKITLQTGETEVPDDVNADLPMWIQREGKSLSVEVTGSGILAMADLPTWLNFGLSGLVKNTRIAFTDTGANGGGYLAGPMLLASFEPSGKKGTKTDISVQLMGADKFVFVPYP